ncbi:MULTISPECIES: hypothetical protein [unclassified Leifsonia]|uniref:hypothetical protein n=1 Tax=unclassified Leifsonia TaxID=2663824 RepID=UPI0008A7AB41|nr:MULTISPECIES: hypothetical protein [unclassified Leifsonia]SEH99093.1 hypothetical protein SAMN04515694_1092 [Leifsonia sp. CL154]SFL68809.1 hypothetical protein SAMN04515692_109133 [Leifsonia sp. CL147]
MTRGLGVVIGVMVALLVVVVSCSAIGYTVKQTNLANQKNAAIKFISGWPDVEEIRFTQEGSVGGGGSWAVNAVVTIAGKEYQEILGPHTLGGEPLPEPQTPPSAASVTVIYSDGTTEVLK